MRTRASFMKKYSRVFSNGILFVKYKYYGLDKNYNYLRSGFLATLSASFMKAYKSGKPIVEYNYEPTWILAKINLVLLKIMENL